MPLGTEVGLGPGDIVRWGLGTELPPPHGKGTSIVFPVELCCFRLFDTTCTNLSIFYSKYT